MDKVGNIYSTTSWGGDYNCGTVFRLDGSGNKTTLHSFADSPSDGCGAGSALSIDKAGSLYGATYFGGAYGYGTLFKLDATGSETILHNFAGAPGDGANPHAGFLVDKARNMYSTTVWGGAYNYGTIFKLDTAGNVTVLHSFTGDDGYYAYAALMLGKGGDFYTTTNHGGAYGNGTLFMLDAAGNGTVLHSFTGTGGDGANPAAALIMGNAANLYSTTSNGGAYGYGTIFKLDTARNVTVLHSFTGADGDGATPFSALITDKDGNMYGTTSNGGAYGYGTIFKLDTARNVTVLHSFAGSPGDGAYPATTLVLDSKGNLYGTTQGGGAYDWGTVFKLIP